MTCRRNIKLLPPEVISNLRSCVAISSVSQCVEELVLNAVDSCAKNIAVRLDLTFFKIQVVDNGFGIPCDQLDLLGERYHTSKCHSVEDLKDLRFNGFRGEALASLRDICAVLEITSRTQDNRTYFKAFHYGKSTEVRLSVDERPSVGTTVTILDFMYNLPVRRKSICTFRDFEHTRRSLECIALVNPNVSFTLRNNQTGETCLSTRRTNSMISSFRSLFGCDKSLKEIVYHSEGMKVQGFISTDSHSTNDLQFLFVNCRLILKTRLHELVRLVLTKYLNSKPRESVQTVPTDESLSPKKTGHPVFAFNILCPFNEYDICFEPRKTLIEFEDWEKVTGVIKDVLRTFLHDEGYRYEDDDKYLKAGPGSTQALYSDASKSCIDTSNTKNALFSLVIRRPKPKRSKHKTCSTDDVNEKNKSAFDVKQSVNQNLYVGNHHRDVKDYNTVTSQTTYPFSVGRESNENKSHVHDSHVPFTQCNPEHTHTSYDDPRFKAGHCSRTVSAGVGTQNRTTHTSSFPISLQFSSKPSSLSALKNRKRKETKLQGLKESFSFQKHIKQVKTCVKARSRSNSVLPNEDHSSSKKYQKIVSGKDSNQQLTPFHSYSSSMDIIDFSDLDTHLVTEGTYGFHDEKCNVSNIQKPAEDKWSILSQSQEIINATEPFLVTQPFSVQPRLENDNSARSTSVKSSVGQDLLHPSDSGRMLTCNSGAVCKSSPSGSQTQVRFDSSYSDNHSQTGHVQSVPSSSQLVNVSAPNQSATSMASTTAHAQSILTASQQLTKSVTNETAANIASSSFEQRGHSATSMSKDQCDGVCVSHSIGSAFPNLENRLKPNKEMSSDQQEWIKWQDLDSGNILYINMATGNSTYVPPPTCIQSKSPNVHMPKKDGHFFLSHNSTPFLPRPDRKSNDLDESTLGDSKSMQGMLDTWQNPVFKRTDFCEISSASHVIRKPVIRVYNIVQNYKFFKNMFIKAEMLGQVDSKFIACMVPSFEENKDANLLALFDQHAVHERIRLEQFTKELYNEDGEVCKTTLQVPLRLEVTPEHARLARVYSNQLEKTTGLGIEVEPSPCSAALSFRCVPVCLTLREASELKNNRPSVLASLTQSLLIEQLQRMKETGSLGGAVPKTLHNVLSSRACKGAIKFGDALSNEESGKLIKHLSACQLPFQCAHGRPSVIPVLDVTHITRPLHWKITSRRVTFV